MASGAGTVGERRVWVLILRDRGERRVTGGTELVRILLEHFGIRAAMRFMTGDALAFLHRNVHRRLEQLLFDVRVAPEAERLLRLIQKFRFGSAVRIVTLPTGPAGERRVNVSRFRGLGDRRVAGGAGFVRGILKQRVRLIAVPLMTLQTAFFRGGMRRAEGELVLDVVVTAQADRLIFILQQRRLTRGVCSMAGGTLAGLYGGVSILFELSERIVTGLAQLRLLLRDGERLRVRRRGVAIRT